MKVEGFDAKVQKLRADLKISDQAAHETVVLRRDQEKISEKLQTIEQQLAQRISLFEHKQERLLQELNSLRNTIDLK